MSDQLNITNEMRMFDRKVRTFYDNLTDEDKRKFSPYLMIRWGSSVEGSRDLQEFYVISTNQRLNRHFFNVNTARHKKLQWLMATTVSPDMGAHRHVWISPKKKESGNSALRRELAEFYPDLKDDELDLLTTITTKQELAELRKSHGRDSR